MLRRLAGSPVKGENYFRADIEIGRLGPDQTTAEAGVLVSRLSRWLPLITAAAAVLVRLPFLFQSEAFFNSDEALEGLMARHIRELPVFFWGQGYKGVPEVYLSAIAFAIFGAGVVQLKAVTMAIWCGAVAVSTRLGQRWYGDIGGAVTGALLVLGPPSVVYWSLSGSAEVAWLTLIFSGVLLAYQRSVDDPGAPDQSDRDDRLRRRAVGASDRGRVHRRAGGHGRAAKPPVARARMGRAGRSDPRTTRQRRHARAHRDAARHRRVRARGVRVDVSRISRECRAGDGGASAESVSDAGNRLGGDGGCARARRRCRRARTGGQGPGLVCDRAAARVLLRRPWRRARVDDLRASDRRRAGACSRCSCSRPRR